MRLDDLQYLLGNTSKLTFQSIDNWRQMQSSSARLYLQLKQELIVCGFPLKAYWADLS